MLEYKNILVPVDFSDISRLAIRKAICAKDAHQGKLILMHIIDYSPPLYAAAEAASIFPSEELMLERAEKQLSSLVSELRAGNVKQLIKIGHAKKELLEYIRDHEIDLVVMAAHSNSPVDKLLGSTTNAVVQRVTCDVLVIHG